MTAPSQSIHVPVCPVCNSTSIERLYTLENVPVFCNIVHDSREDAVNTTKGVIDLSFCNDCGHLFNNAFDEKLMNYSVEYENSLHFSEKFQEFAIRLATELINKYGIVKKNIIEIGCGKGDFLKIIANLGSNRGYGFDASYEFNEEDRELNNVTFYQEFYSDKFSDIPADLILCRHVLEHINKPRYFLDTIKSAVDRYRPVFYFEVPNALYTLRDKGIWDLIYEHYSYYNPQSLARLLHQFGFHIYSLQEVYNNQFLSSEFGANKIDHRTFKNSLPVDEIRSLAGGFRKSYEEKLGYWRDLLDNFQKTGKKVVLWGGGSKGVTFLNVFREYDFLQEVVDINPKKQGKYVSGSGQRYISPRDLTGKGYDTVIVMNPIYTQEIRETLRELELDPEVLEA